MRITKDEARTMLHENNQTSSTLILRIIPCLVMVIVTSHGHHTCVEHDGAYDNQQRHYLGHVNHTGEKLIPIEMSDLYDHEHCVACLLLVKGPDPIRAEHLDFRCTNPNVEYIFLVPFDPALIRHPRGPPPHS